MPIPTSGTAHARAPFWPYASSGAVAIAANKSAPQPVGSTIRWTATPPGRAARYEYKWLVHNGSEWQVVVNWSPSNTFAWTPPFANARYIVAVQVRIAGRSRDTFESFTTEAAFAILAEWPPSIRPRSVPPPAVLPVSTVTLRPSLSSPQRPGTTITWRAAATGGGAGLEYKWFVYDGRRWTVAMPWSTTDIFSWTPTTPNQRYRVSVWARRTGSTTDYFEASAEDCFTID